MAVTLPDASRDAMCDALVDLVDIGSANTEGLVRVYDGSRPAVSASVTDQNLLAEFEMADPAYGTSTNGTATLLGTPLQTTGETNGTATWVRVVDKDEDTIFDGSVGTSDADFIINTVSITTGVAVEITDGSFVMPSGE